LIPRGLWKRRAIHVVFVVLVLGIAVFGHQLRWVRAEATVADLGTPTETWFNDDPDAAYHLRRIELAMATGDVPNFDRMIAHPEGSAVPWPPFFDGLVALYLETHVGNIGPLGMADATQAHVEAQAARIPPLMGIGALVLMALAAAMMVRRVQPHPAVRSRGWVLAPMIAGVLAAFAYSTMPIAIWYADAGRIDHHVFVALLFAANVVVMAQIFACGRFESERTNCDAGALDATLGGLTGGAIAGIALLSWLASALFIAVAGVTFWLASTAMRNERAQSARRAGALYFLTAAAITIMPASLSAWNISQPWSLVNLTLGVPLALAVAAFALFVPSLLPAEVDESGYVAPRGRLVAFLAPPLVGAFAYLLLPGFGEGVREGLAWANRGNLFMDVVDESRPLVEVGAGSLWQGLNLDLGWAGLALPVVLLWIALNVSASLDRTRGGARPEARFHLLLNLVVFGFLTLEQRRFGNSLAVPLAIAVGMVGGLAVARLENGYARDWRGRTLAGLGLALSLVLFAGGALEARALLATPKAELESTRAWRAQVIDGLKWMRTNTPSSGPVAMAAARHEYGVLSSWSMGHLIEYYAERPAIATNFGSFVSEANFRGAAAALLERDPETFLAALRDLDARYIVVTPRMAADLASQARMAGLQETEWDALFERVDGVKVYSEAARDSALWRLALVPSDHAPDYPGLERVYAAPEHESLLGGNQPGPSGPMLSIWKVSDALD
jgi:asparagine N-glycosylation enzyme membrane subunit Stt3